MAIFNLPRALTLSLCFGSAVFGFTPTLRISLRRKDQRSLVGLDMAKKLRNKQADLAAKMAALKKEKSEKPEGSKTKRSTDEELKEQNDRLRFDELLKTQSTSLNSVSSDGYLSREQEDEEINAFSKSEIVHQCDFYHYNDLSLILTILNL